MPSHQTQQLSRVAVWLSVKASYYDAGFDAFWELDLFGRVRRNLEAI